MRATSPAGFFSEEEKQILLTAIREAEQKTSGEIRVHLLRSFKKGEDPFKAGKRIFEKLGMTQTRLKNGILFILELQGRRLVLLGDQGIHERVDADFWERIRDQVLQEFKEEKFAQGLARGITACGIRLKELFPRAADDINELSDEISFSAKT